jgi:hypothetical protein
MNYFFKKNNITLGPIPLADLLKIIDANTEISEDGTQWALAKDIPALASALGLGRPIGPPPLPTSKPKPKPPPPPPPTPPSMPRQQVIPPLQSPQFEKSSGLSLRTVLVTIVIVGLLIFAGIAYMDGPGNSSPYTPSRSNNLDDYNQDEKSSSTKTEEESATPGANYRKSEEEAKPQKVQCITCNGTSKVEGKCFSCDGSGRDFGLDCNICDGSGLRPIACKSCDGDGWVND